MVQKAVKILKFYIVTIELTIQKRLNDTLAFSPSFSYHLYYPIQICLPRNPH